MTQTAEADARRIEQERRFISEVFHELSQPLTALHCSLELSLLTDTAVPQFRASVEAALDNAERLRRSLLQLHELTDANDAGCLTTPVNLRGILRQLAEEMWPLLESSGRRLELTAEEVYVSGDGEKLTHGFFRLLEFLLRDSAPAGTLGRQPIAICVSVESDKRLARVSISAPRLAESAHPDGAAGSHRPFETEVAARTFRAAGGELELIAMESATSVYVVKLPLAC